MILYLDASALVKKYVAETGTAIVVEAIGAADLVGTSVLSRAESVAALAKALRMNVLALDSAKSAIQLFRSEWQDIVRIQATEAVIERADTLAWEFGLRGYDSVHLASALIWQEQLAQDVTIATFDRQLWQVAEQSGLLTFPKDLPSLLASWRN